MSAAAMAPRTPAKILNPITAATPIRGATVARSDRRICHGMRRQTMTLGGQRAEINGPT
jgi:hypothetical protein